MSGLIDQLYGQIPREDYACIRCVVCNGVYRWGRKHMWQSACPYCGAVDFRPNEVTRLEYAQFLEALGSPLAMEVLQKELWNPHTVER